MATTPKASDFRLADHTIAPGKQLSFEIPVARLPSGTWLSLPVTVLHGRKPGPTVWISATIHGDELNGIESIRRALTTLTPRSLAGTVIAVPIVNVFGFVDQSRYLPDRRDLNRSFPGSPNGSLASRLAHLFMSTIVAACDVGIDLHTGSDHRENLPQIRADLNDPATKLLAEAFGAPVMIHSRLRDGSLREAASAHGTRVLLFEGGEATRFNEHAISAGTDGVLRTLASLGVIEHAPAATHPPLQSHHSRWVRARRGGIVRLQTSLGEHLQRGDVLAIIADPAGNGASRLRAPIDGLVVALSRNPLANQGDAIAHLAEIQSQPEPPAPA